MQWGFLMWRFYIFVWISCIMFVMEFTLTRLYFWLTWHNHTQQTENSAAHNKQAKWRSLQVGASWVLPVHMRGILTNATKWKWFSLMLFSTRWVYRSPGYHRAGQKDKLEYVIVLAATVNSEFLVDLASMFFGLREVGEPGENPCRCREIRQTPHRKTPGPGKEPTTLLVWGDSQASCLVWDSRFHNLTSTGLGKAAHCCGLFCLIVALASFPPVFLDFSNRHVEFIMAGYLAGSHCVNTGVPNNANQACISFNSCWLTVKALSHQL